MMALTLLFATIKYNFKLPLPTGEHLGLLSHLPADVQVMTSTLCEYPTSHVTLAVSPYSVDV